MSFIDDLKFQFEDIGNALKNEFAKMNENIESKKAEIVAIRTDIRETVGTMSGVIKVLDDFSDTVSDTVDDLETISDEATLVLVSLDSIDNEILTNEIEAEDRMDFIGYCENCGEEIFEDSDERVSEDNLVFCNNECRDDYNGNSDEDDSDEEDSEEIEA